MLKSPILNHKVWRIFAFNKIKMSWVNEFKLFNINILCLIFHHGKHIDCNTEKQFNLHAYVPCNNTIINLGPVNFCFIWKHFNDMILKALKNTLRHFVKRTMCYCLNDDAFRFFCLRFQNTSLVPYKNTIPIKHRQFWKNIKHVMIQCD